MSDALIKKLHDAVKKGHIDQPFTGRTVDNWRIDYKIKNEDDLPYARSYKSSGLLANSYLYKNKESTNGNSIWLDRRKNHSGVYEYWFND